MNSDDARPTPEPVATGDRRDEAHYVRDPKQVVRARFLTKPADLPPDMHTGRIDAASPPPESGLPVEDVAVAPPSPSAWDARPPEDDAERRGNPTPH